MIRSMFSAISGLRNHQTMMDVVGNNIANVNTNGFKSSSTVFADVLSQSVRGSGQASATSGGTNPSTIGLGSRVAGITSNFAQGSLQRTGRSTDFAIQGDGFFVVDNAAGRSYTRAGSLNVDGLGRIVTNEGSFVQGWQADVNGNLLTNGPVSNITIPIGGLIAPVQTTSVKSGGNLPADAAVGTVITNGVDVYDAQGNPTAVRLEYTKTAANTWKVEARYLNSSGTLVPATSGAGQAITGSPLVFNAAGELTSGYNATLPAGFLPGFASQAVTLNFGTATDPGRINQFGEVQSVGVLDQDGSGAGSLQSFAVSQEGLIVGTYSNGRTKTIGQFALATFANPEGLLSMGNSSFNESVNSGLAQIGVADGGVRGLITAGTLEMSNVDLSTEFTNLIIAQRGFQANSRVITTSDEMLQEVVNLKR